MKKYIRYLNDRYQDILSAIFNLVKIESPSYDSKQCLEAALYIVSLVKNNCNANVELIHNENGGAHVFVELGDGEENILLVGHFDTVHPNGSIKLNPCRQEGNRIYGPLIYDIKAGIIQAIFALRICE